MKRFINNMVIFARKSSIIFYNYKEHTTCKTIDVGSEIKCVALKRERIVAGTIDGFIYLIDGINF